MSITYPLQLPDQNIRGVRIVGEKVAAVAQSPFTLSTQVLEWPGERWAAQVTLPPMVGRDRAEEWAAFLLALRGPVGTFEMGDPLARWARGNPTGTPVTDGIQTAQAKTIATTGWTVDAPGVLLAGDYIEITHSAKKYLHKVLADVDADGLGEAVIDVFPNVRAAYADVIAIVTAECKGTFRLVDPSQGWDANYLRVYGIEFTAVEAT